MTMIGASFENVNVQDIINNWKFFAKELLNKKLIAFRNIKIDRYEHHDLLYVLQNGGQPESEMIDFCPSKNLDKSMEKYELREDGDAGDATWTITERGYVIDRRCHRKIDKNFLQPEYAQEFFEWSIHVDTPLGGHAEENKSLQAYTSMYMMDFKYQEGIGNTYFTSMIDMYEKISPHWSSLVGNAFIDEWRGGKDRLEKLNTWPVLHTHPKTQEQIFFYPSWNSEIIPNDSMSVEMCKEIKSWVQSYFLNSANWTTWKWREGDFIMWDNRCLIHRFDGGWESDKRVFSQGGVHGLPPIRLS